MVLDSLAFWQMALDGIQIGLCSLILIFLIRNKIKYNQFVPKPLSGQSVGNFKTDLWFQSIRQQADQSFDAILNTFERERRSFEKLLEARGLDPRPNRRTVRTRDQIEKHMPPDIDPEKNSAVNTADGYGEVKRLAREGMSTREISESLKVPLNEVELILKLTQKVS